MGERSILDEPDRSDCVRPHGCRSPFSCHSLERCADAMSPAEDMLAFGYGSGVYGGLGLGKGRR